MIINITNNLIIIVNNNIIIIIIKSYFELDTLRVIINIILINIILVNIILSNIIIITRSYTALRAADLDWIVRPGYSLGRVHSGEKP